MSTDDAPMSPADIAAAINARRLLNHKQDVRPTAKPFPEKPVRTRTKCRKCKVKLQWQIGRDQKTGIRLFAQQCPRCGWVYQRSIYAEPETHVTA